MERVSEKVKLDLARMTLRQVNDFLHHQMPAGPVSAISIINPNGMHNIAVGVDADVDIEILGHVGYYAAGMNKQANITICGNAGKSVAENIMSGIVRVKGNASQCVAASGHGGLVVIEGDASSRCGISMKGCNIVVGGSVGHASGFMAQLGHMVVCGNAGAGLGDSLYEAVIYVRGDIAGLGADARFEKMSMEDVNKVAELLAKAALEYDPRQFKRVASGRTLYHWNKSKSRQYG